MVRSEKEVKEKLKEWKDIDLPFPDSSMLVIQREAKIEVLYWVLEKTKD